jgi:DNA sulfur modification protein DndB
MGDRGYFVAAMHFAEIAERVQAIPEVHTSKKLAEWIQRRLDHKHAAEIAAYLKTEEARFFNALVIGVYGGDPQWAELSLGDPQRRLEETEKDRIARTVGVLVLSGKEKLFPIDGQHRVAGIKKALQDGVSLSEEEIAVVLVGHARTEEGMKRTRRLFVTLNQRAKKVSPRDIVALDEDNGLAVTTRRLIDDYSLFQKSGFVSFSGNVALLEHDTKAITSVLGLFQIVKGLYPRSGVLWPKLQKVQKSRPPEPTLDQIYNYYIDYWETLIKTVPEYKEVLAKESQNADHFRHAKTDHLLFRPVGQLAFARAVEFLTARKVTLKDAIRLVHSKNTMHIRNKVWWQILWNPVKETIVNNWSAAQTLLLVKAGADGISEEALSRLRKLQQ